MEKRAADGRDATMTFDISGLLDLWNMQYADRAAALAAFGDRQRSWHERRGPSPARATLRLQPANAIGFRRARWRKLNELQSELDLKRLNASRP